MKIKICGFTRADDMAVAVDAGADALGLVLADGPCRLEPEQARTLLQETKDLGVERVAVVGRMALSQAPKIAALGFDTIQVVVQDPEPNLDGSPLLPVFFDSEDIESRIQRWCEAQPFEGLVSIDGPKGGGKGIPADWHRAAQIARKRPLMLAGGLNPDNVGRAIELVRPRAVDVSSATERTPGVKDHSKIRDFIAAAREASVPDTQVTG